MEFSCEEDAPINGCSIVEAGVVNEVLASASVNLTLNH